jgi:ribosome-binding factor A
MARKTSNRERGPSQRQLRVGEEIRHVLAGVMMRGELHDPALDGVSVTISEVRISPDLKNAKVFSLPLAGTKVADVMKGLNRCAPFLRAQVGKAMQLRYAPTLTFVADTSFDEAHHIEELLRSEKVARDLKAAREKAEREADDGEN